MNAEALTNPAAEWSIISAIVSDPSIIGEVIGTQLTASDFMRTDARLIYEATVERYFADQPVDALTVVEGVRVRLAKIWEVAEQNVPDAMLGRVGERDFGKTVMEHVAIVRRHATARGLFTVASNALALIGAGEKTPEEIAGSMSTEALAVTSGTIARTELMNWMDTGREFARHMERLRLAREKGIEMAVYTSFPFIDDYTKGIAPTELCFIAGAPGVGKSVLAWKAAEGFAYRQLKKDAEHRIATLVVSMEMGAVPSSTRLAQSITGIDGMRLREGDITNSEYEFILREWKARDGLPIYFNYASNFRLSQLRALIVEAIRNYNVGFVVIDHFRQIDPDKHIENSNDADEVKVRFLKESIAKDLNVAVLCLAHTVKIGRSAEGAAARPRLSDLRGSGQIAANADFVGFMHKPGKNLSDEERLMLGIGETDAELIWEKARHTEDGTAYFRFEPRTMTISPR